MRWDVVSGAGNLVERTASAAMSRGQFLRRTALAGGAVAGLGLLRARGAFGASGFDPKPIPGGFDENFNPVPSDPFIHVLPPTIGFEMATITDFDGVLAAAEIQGTAHGTDGSQYTFDTDMRFMQGRYVGMDGHLRTGSFGFI
jgi:hypothetical protein